MFLQYQICFLCEIKMCCQNENQLVAFSFVESPAQCENSKKCCPLRFLEGYLPSVEEIEWLLVSIGCLQNQNLIGSATRCSNNKMDNRKQVKKAKNQKMTRKSTFHLFRNLPIKFRFCKHPILTNNRSINSTLGK